MICREAPPPESIVVPIYLRCVGTVIAYNNALVRSQITGNPSRSASTRVSK